MSIKYAGIIKTLLESGEESSGFSFYFQSTGPKTDDKKKVAEKGLEQAVEQNEKTTN